MFRQKGKRCLRIWNRPRIRVARLAMVVMVMDFISLSSNLLRKASLSA